MSIFYPDNIASRTALPASGISSDSNLLLNVSYSGVEKRLSLEELKKTNLDIINVLQYGADPLGVNSSAIAFTNATVAAISSGKAIYVPPGLYNLASLSGLTINGDFSIFGDGPEFVEISGSDVVGFAGISANSRVRIQGIKFIDFNSIFSLSTSTSGAPHKDIIVKNVETDSCAYAITDNGAAAYLGNVDITDCKFLNLTGAGVQLRYTSADRIYISNCEIGPITGSADVFGILLGTLSASTTGGDVAVVNCYIHDLYTSSVAEDCLGIFVESKVAYISGNRIKNLYAANTNVDHEAIYVKSDHSVIIGNRLEDAGGDEGSIVAKGDRRDGSVAGNPDGFNVIIANNHVVFTNSLIVDSYTINSIDASTEIITSSGHDLVTYDAVKFSNSGGTLPSGLSSSQLYYVISPSGNTFKVSLTSNGSAVNIGDSGTGTNTINLIHTGTAIRSIMEGTLITGNTFDLCGVSLASADYSIISNNIFYNTPGTAIDLYECPGAIATGNTIYGWSPKYNASYCVLLRANTRIVQGNVISNNVIHTTNTASDIAAGRIVFGLLDIGAGSLSDVSIQNNNLISAGTHLYLGTGGPSNVYFNNNSISGAITLINGSEYPTTFHNNMLNGASASTHSQGNKTGVVSALWKLYDTVTMTMTGNIDFTSGFTAPNTPKDLNLILSQNGTGGYTVTFPTINWKSGVLQPASGAGATSIYQFYYDGTQYHEMSVNN